MTLASINSATSVFSQLEKQRKLKDSLANPFPLQRWIEQQQRQRKLLEDPFGFREREKMIQQMIRPPVLEQFARQQRLMDELVRGPQILRSLATVYGSIPSGVIEQVEDYGEDLIDEITYGASNADEPVEVLEEGLSRVAAEREAIVIALNRTSKILGGMYLGGVAIPPLVVVLVLVFAVLGEVADEVLLERENRAPRQN
jgi:hypothetical protein